MQEGFPFTVMYRQHQYSVMGNIIKPDPKRENEYLILLYWLDETELKTIQKKYLDEKTDVCVILIDNYDDVMNSMGGVDKTADDLYDCEVYSRVDWRRAGEFFEKLGA